MKYDATLKKLFRQPPNRLLSSALGQDVVVVRTLPTDLITVENLHPDLLFETVDGTLIHAELHGYNMKGFATRKLAHFALLERDHGRFPVQVVFWIGPGNVGVTAGIHHPPQLDYRYIVIDVREVDGEELLESECLEESIFAVLCKLRDRRSAVAGILRRIGELPVERQREAVAELLILSGLRGLRTLIGEEVKKMPVSIDIHENEFLEEVFQDGRNDGRNEGRNEGRLASAREMLLSQLAEKFGAVPASTQRLVESSDLATLQLWSRRLVKAATIGEILG